jgi:membrane-associated phospholipid phosphatase
MRAGRARSVPDRRHRVGALGVATALFVGELSLGGVGAAFAEEPPAPPAVPTPEAPADAIVWKDEWTRVGAVETVLAATALATTTVAFFTFPQHEDALEGGVFPDDDIRRAFALEGRSSRDLARDVGDSLYYGLSAYPLADALLVALALRGAPDVAWQMVVIDVEALSLTGLVSTATQRFVGRVRPFADRCARDPEYDDECFDAKNRSQGFVSGHVAMAVTGASLTCVHHLHLGLSGGDEAAAAVCAAAYAGSALVGTSRIVADRHYLSDVLAGAAVGLGAGLLLPELAHYHFHFDDADHPLGRARITPSVGPDQVGLVLTL